MKKQYIIEWITKKGYDGWKSLGYDLTNEEVEKQLLNKIKRNHIASVRITWSPVGNDVSNERIGEENRSVSLSSPIEDIRCQSFSLTTV